MFIRRRYSYWCSSIPGSSTNPLAGTEDVPKTTTPDYCFVALSQTVRIRTSKSYGAGLDCAAIAHDKHDHLNHLHKHDHNRNHDHHNLLNHNLHDLQHLHLRRTWLQYDNFLSVISGIRFLYQTLVFELPFIVILNNKTPRTTGLSTSVVCSLVDIRTRLICNHYDTIIIWSIPWTSSTSKRVIVGSTTPCNISTQSPCYFAYSSTYTHSHMHTHTDTHTCIYTYSHTRIHQIICTCVYWIVGIL